GGGWGVASPCHSRLAVPGAQIALPEVKLGLIPGADGTQLLPRAVGLESALNMIVSGALVPAEQLKGTVLFDALPDGNLLQAAIAFASNLSPATPPKRLRDLRVEHPNPEGFLAFARNVVGAASKGYPAPLKCIEAVAAAVSKPYEEGLRVERELFGQLMQTPESKALRHAFFAERAAAKIPGLPENLPLRPIRTAAVIGAGTMGGGIAMSFANAGIPVTVVEVKQDALEKGTATMRKNYEASAKKGKLTAAQLAERMGSIHPTLSYAHVAQPPIISQ